MIHKDSVIRRLARWGEEREAIRAMLLTGSRANPNALVDAWSDYDVLLAVGDIHPFFVDRAWLQDSGQVLVAYWDPIHPAPDFVGLEQVGNVVLYQDGLKVDFILWPVGDMVFICTGSYTIPGTGTNEQLRGFSK
jgi:aminoglycoside 6-adenylyltransferase